MEKVEEMKEESKVEASGDQLDEERKAALIAELEQQYSGSAAVE